MFALGVAVQVVLLGNYFADIFIGQFSIDEFVDLFRGEDFLLVDPPVNVDRKNE